MLNLENPIFVYYLCVNGMTSQKANELIASIRDQYTYSNATVWVVPVDHPSRIECLHVPYKF